MLFYLSSSLMRVIVRFKALHYPPTGRLWMRQTGTNNVV